MHLLFCKHYVFYSIVVISYTKETGGIYKYDDLLCSYGYVAKAIQLILLTVHHIVMVMSI